MDTYTLHEHGWMVGHAVRTSGYVEALRRVVKPGDTVLDIGTGVGTWAVAACRAGARRVYAVDPSSVIQVGRDLAAANDCADRIEFIQGLSTELTLPEPIDVIVQEIHGVLPMCGSSLATIIDARTRLLAPGGTLVPRHETLWAALVNCQELYEPHDRPWGRSDHGFNLAPVRAALTNYWLKRPVRTESLVATPQVWATLDYATLDSPHVRGGATWTIGRPSILHGVALWFDAVLADGVAFSNAPDQPGLPFGQAFFPWRQPVAVEAGDSVRVDLIARLLDEDYVWHWAISVTGRTGFPKVRLEQSDFWCDAISSDIMRRAEAGYIPGPNPERSVDAFVLDAFDRLETAKDIVEELALRFPDRFSDSAVALGRVATLASAYGVDVARPRR